MEIIKNVSGEELTLNVSGRLDTNTAPLLDAEIKEVGVEIKKLVLDFEGLEYISSAGLRTVLMAQKKMNKQGVMLVKNVNESVMEVFQITGFSDILVIE
ncbi:MAG: STAS domain-containing protein [Clostridiales bacterium]|nr:STAS domain-containing protein [Clostridiales bacterium]